ncbi:MAG: nucleoside recognition protein [Bacteroidales bacterium]|nr:nucleoside recognition protein [Bacteroidales bacterium]
MKRVGKSQLDTLNHSSILKRIANCVKNAMPSAIKTSLWFLKITIPISFTVTLLYHFGILNVISEFLSPAFNLIGLKGEAALVYITSAFLNVYSAIAVITSLNFTLREMTILAIMSLIAHNLIVETAVQKKTGSKVWHIIALRIISSIAAAALLNLLLPAQMGSSGLGLHQISNPIFKEVLSTWTISALKLSIKIVVLITLLMILQKILIEFKITDLLTKIFGPFLKIMGLSGSTSVMWMAANLLGLAYGSAIMIDEVESGRITRQDADLLNFHIAISHSNLEDLILFAAIGVSAWWLFLPRLGMAIIVVWGRRFATSYKGN